MEEEPGCGGCRPILRIQRVAQNRVTDRGEMKSDLVRSASDRFDLQPRPIGKPLEHPPPGLRTAAILFIDPVPWRSGRIPGDRAIDQPPIICEPAQHHAFIPLAHFTPFELPAQLPLGGGIEGHKHEARGVTVETVDHDRGGNACLHAAGQAIGTIRTPARYCEQSGRLFEHDDPGITMNEDGLRHTGKPISPDAFLMLGTGRGGLAGPCSPPANRQRNGLRRSVVGSVLGGGRTPWRSGAGEVMARILRAVRSEKVRSWVRKKDRLNAVISFLAPRA